MPTREERTLRLIKGASLGTPARNIRRRTFTRHVPPPREPVEDVLKTLDEEPVRVEEPASPAGEEPASPAARKGAPEREAPAVPRRRRVLIGLLVAALAAALAGAGVFGHRWYADRSLAAAHQAALAAAKQTTVNFVSVSASSVDRDLQRISAGATGEFKEQFDRGQSQVRKAIVENKVESRGSVLRAGLVSGDHRSAVVLVAIDATVKNVKAPDGRPSHYRIQVDVTRDERGAWLVSRLQFVG